jgi:hypothetical protein
MKKPSTATSALNRARVNKTGTAKSEIRLRLIRDDDVPASHEFAEAYVFLLQDTKQRAFQDGDRPMANSCLSRLEAR